MDFVVDADVRELQPFVRVAPAGSLIAESKDNAGFVNDASDLDSFRFYAHAGERIAARIQPAQQVTLTAQLYGVTALAPAASSPTAGESVDLPLTQIPADGYYELRIQASGPTRFTAELTRNAELERRIGDSDSSHASGHRWLVPCVRFRTVRRPGNQRTETGLHADQRPHAVC